MIEYATRASGIVWLGDRDAALRRVGGKAAQLSKLAGVHRVPPGFCLTADAFGATGEPLMTGELREQLAAAYQLLGERTGVDEPRVAVRSSAIDEDGPLASFAGLHETFLNVAGIDAVVEAVERCLASARSDRALAYRERHGLAAGGVGVAVIVQQLVMADASAVLFSANPISGRRDEMVLTASWGLGESIVGGTVTPDTWLIGREGLHVRTVQIGGKERMTIAVPGGTREVDVPRMLRGQLSLTPGQVVEVAQLGLRLEQALGWPVDIECAYAGGELFLLQARPITTIGGLPGVVEVEGEAFEKAA